MAKKYYWLKLQNDFFSQTVIKKLRRIAGGDTYTIIYLKLLLLSLKNEGKIFYEGVEDDFAKEMALRLDEDDENVALTLSFLQKHGLIEETSVDEFMLPETVQNIGSETQGAERVRRFREKQKALLGNNDVTNCNTEKRREEKNREDIDKNKKKDIEKEQIESIWKMYPLKKGKVAAIKKIPKLIKKYGFEQIERCIERYKQYVEHRQHTDFRELKYQNGSTFFNGTYEDYLDENWKEGNDGINKRKFEKPEEGQGITV